MGVKGYPGVDAQTTGLNQPSHQAQGDPWPWPQSQDKLPKPAPQFDDDAHRAFMRGLG